MNHDHDKWLFYSVFFFLFWLYFICLSPKQYQTKVVWKDCLRWVLVTCVISTRKRFVGSVRDCWTFLNPQIRQTLTPDVVFKKYRKNFSKISQKFPKNFHEKFPNTFPRIKIFTCLELPSSTSFQLHVDFQQAKEENETERIKFFISTRQKFHCRISLTRQTLTMNNKIPKSPDTSSHNQSKKLTLREKFAFKRKEKDTANSSEASHLEINFNHPIHPHPNSQNVASTSSASVFTPSSSDNGQHFNTRDTLEDFSHSVSNIQTSAPSSDTAFNLPSNNDQSSVKDTTVDLTHHESNTPRSTTSSATAFTLLSSNDQHFFPFSETSSDRPESREAYTTSSVIDVVDEPMDGNDISNCMDYRSDVTVLSAPGTFKSTVLSNSGIEKVCKPCYPSRANLSLLYIHMCLIFLLLRMLFLISLHLHQRNPRILKQNLRPHILDHM